MKKRLQKDRSLSSIIERQQFQNIEGTAVNSPLRVVKFSVIRTHRTRSDNGSFSPVRKLSSHRKSSVALRSRKRTKSERDSDLGKMNAEDANSMMLANHLKYNSTIVDDESQIPDMIITQPPALELKDVWGLFIEESYRRKYNHPMIRQVRRQPIFELMTVLVLENHGIEKIFEYLRPCKNLVALSLKGNRVITRDLVEIQHLEKLRSVDLSNNGIHFLPDPERLAKVANLEYLQLHENLLVGWRQLENLTCLTNLRHMTLQGNPSAKILGYRQFLVDNLPQLRSLDDYIVMDFERSDIKTMFPPENIKKDKLVELWRFRPFNKATTSWVPRPLSLPDPRPLEKESDVAMTIKQDGFQMTMELEFVNRHLEKMSYELRRKFEFCSPILTVQKTAKMFIYRKKYLKKRRLAKLMLWSLNRWNLRGHLHHFRSRLGLTASLLSLIGKIRLIQKLFRQWKRKKELLQIMARRGQTVYRMKKVQNKTLQSALGLTQSNQNCQQRTLLFKKAQIQMLQNVGLIKQALSIQESARFVLRKGIKTHKVEIRRSILMNLVISSYRCVRVIRAQSLFSIAVQSAIQKLQNEKKDRQSIRLRPNTQIDDAIIPDMLLKQQQQQQIDGQKLESKMQKSKPRREQWKKMNKFIKPSLEPHVAHHVNREARGSISQVLSAPIIDENTALMEVIFSGDIEVALVLQTIASYNRRHEDVVQIFYEPFLRRFEATMILQRWFKGILFRRRLKPLFIERTGNKFVLIRSLAERAVTVENTIYSHYVLIQRVSRMIQRNFRRWKLRVRIKCLANIADYASRVGSNEVYIEQTAYRSLEAIFQSATGAPFNPHHDDNTKGNGTVEAPKQRQSLTRSKKQKVPLAKKQLEIVPHVDKTQTLTERRFKFDVSAKTYKVGISFGSKVDKAGRYATSNLPLWFQRKTNTEIRRLPPVKRQTPQSQFANNVMSLIHMQALAVNEGAPVVVKLRDIQMAIVEKSMTNTKLIKICHSTIEEAKNRAIVLALLTCNVRKGSSSFVRFYTANDFQGRRISERSCSEIRGVWQDNGIVDDDIRTYLVPEYTLQAQPHCGLIRKREEPYMTLLRARPKDKKAKSKFERFIVLGDADPKHIEETLGSAMIYNEVVGQMQPPVPIPDAELYASTDMETDFPYKGRYSQAVVTKQGAARQTSRQEATVKLRTDMEGNVKMATIDPATKRVYHVSKHGSPKSSRLTPAEIAHQKLVFKQNSEKTYKVEVLQNKLRYIQKMILMNQSRDPGFKTLFIQELIPLLQKQNKQMEKLEKEIEERENALHVNSLVQQPSLVVTSQHMSDGNAVMTSGVEHQAPDETAESRRHIRRKTFTFQVPKPNENGENQPDQGKKAAETADESAEDQIQRLFKEYKHQKEAYRKAVRISMLSNNNLTVSKKLESKIWNNVGRKTSRNEVVMKSSTTPGESLVNIKVAASQMVDFSTKDNELVLKRYSQLVDEDKSEIENSFRQMVQGRSTDSLRKANLLNQTQRFVKDIKKMENQELAKTFVNQSNSLANLQRKSQKESVADLIRNIKKKQVVKFKQSPKRISPKKLFGPNSKSPRHHMKDDQPQDSLIIDNQKSEKFGAEINPTVQQQVQGSAQKRYFGLKDSSSYIRRDSNVQKLAVLARKLDQSPTQHQNYSVPTLVTIDKEKITYSPPPIEEKQLASGKRPAIKQLQKRDMFQLPQKEDSSFRATQTSKMNKFLGHSSQNVHLSDGFKIPTVKKSKDQRQVNVIKKRPVSVLSSSRQSVSGMEKNRVSQTTSVMEAIDKTNEIIADIKDMERARELASIQAAQNPSKTKLNVSSQLMLFQKTRNPSQEPTLINKSPLKTKLQAHMAQKMKELKQLSNKMLTDRSSSTQPIKPLAKSMTQKTITLTTIETIMRLRKLREEDKRSMLDQTQAMPEDGLQSYFIEGEMMQTARQLKRAHSPFTYELNDLQTPSKDLIGKSRSRSTNMYNRVKKKRVLSFLPTLAMKQSPGKLPIIQ